MAVLLGMLVACDSDDGDSAGADTTGSSTSTDDGEPESTSEGTAAADASTDTGVADSSSGETGTDASSSTGGGEVSCAAPVLDVTFELDPDGASGQIQPGVVFDAAADGVWVTYNKPAADGSGQFDVFATRVGCDGIGQIEPVLVNQTSGTNDIDPELARSGDDIVVTWSADDGSGGGANLAILLQALELDGQPRWTRDVALATTMDGRPFVGSAWMPRLAAGDDGQFALIGTRAIEAASAFQVFVQRFDATATPVGDTAAFAPAVGVANDTPHLAVGADGEIVAAWVRTEDFELRQVETGVVADDAFAPDDPQLLTAAHAVGPTVAVTAQGPWIAAGQGQGASSRIRVSAVGATDVAYTPDDGQIDHTPALVATESAAAVVWYRNLGGLANEIRFAGVTVVDGVPSIGEPTVIPDAVAAPYATTATHVGGDVVFVAWAQGDSPNFRVYGRFVATTAE